MAKLFLALLFIIPTLGLASEHRKTALLVDKATSTLSVAEVVDGEYKVIKTYHATMGQVKGDKEDEGDLKTPEGIYTFKTMLTPPGLAKKFGDMAFYLNYPNDFDRLAGHSGSNIMLHATDEPGRLKKDYDSLGCVVVRNEELHEIKPYIRVGLTPILIFPELSLTDPVYMKPGQDGELRKFFESWVKAWETKDIDAYIDHYHSGFKENGMNRAQYRVFKGSLNKRYASINVKTEDVLFFRHPKYSVITFTQDYQSKLRGGGWGHRSRGTKILYVAEEAGHPKIIAESYTTLRW